jgi:hypothetical protein
MKVEKVLQGGIEKLKETIKNQNQKFHKKLVRETRKILDVHDQIDLALTPI